MKPPGDARMKIVRETLTVDADSDFTIYCLLRELERWRDRNNGNYPQTWYIENANKYVLAALEFLVIKRVVQKNVLTRMPVGHTHEDIDACFGNIAVYFQRNIIQTPQDYMKQMEAAFNGSSNSKLKCSVEDVFVVP